MSSNVSDNMFIDYEHFIVNYVVGYCNSSKFSNHIDSELHKSHNFLKSAFNFVHDFRIFFNRSNWETNFENVTSMQWITFSEKRINAHLTSKS